MRSIASLRTVGPVLALAALAPGTARAAASDDEKALAMERLTWMFESGCHGTDVKEWSRLVDFLRTGPTDQVRSEAARRLVTLATENPVPATTDRQRIEDASRGKVETDKVRSALGRIARDRRAHERARHHASTALEEIACLVDMKQIADRRGAGGSWRSVLRYLQTGPTASVQQTAARVLATMDRREVAQALVDIAADTEEQRQVRGTAVRALAGMASLLRDEDITRILASDEKGWSVAHALVDEVAGASNLGLEQVQAILERYDRAEHSQKVPVVNFAGTQLKTHKGGQFDREIRPVLKEFLTSRARALSPEQLERDPNLRWMLARALEDNRIPGAVELYVDCLREQLENREKGKSFAPLLYLRSLEALTGESMGYNRRLRPEDPATLEACDKWLAWWEANKVDVRYKLPEEASTEPAAGREAKAVR
jgi:hypothetical protein